ncbi:MULTISPECIES: ATP-binding protein [unclassified Thiocapsa]|uniref:sensor histidine kinase n=1 Tax=unclassified Thiocapsa TaxID=2641286 RepID=UPI0035B24044
MTLQQRLSSLGFQLTAGFLGLVLLFAGAGLYAVGAFQRQLAYDALVEIAGRLELAAEQIHAQAMNYEQNAPRDYPTYYRDVRLYYRDLTTHVATFDQVVDAFMKGDFSHEVPTPLPWMMPRLGGGVTLAIRDLEQTWEGWRGALFEAIGEDTEEPRLEWAAEHVIAEHAVLGDATATLTQALRDWTASEYRKVVQGALALAVVVALVAVALLIVLHYRVLAPLRRTIAGFQRVADGDFGHRTPVEGSTEIRELTGSFNRLSVRLDLLHQLIRRLQQGSDLDELVAFLSGEFRDLLGFDWIGVVFIDDARANAHVETGWLDGRPQPSDRRLYRLQGTLLESALADAAPLHVADAVGRVRENPAYEFLGHLVALGMRDAIFLPLTAQTQTPVPAVVVFATRRPEGFDGARRRLLGNIAQLLTQAFGRTARFAEQGRLAAIGEFASGIAHELRTPLTTVSMALESLAGLALDERAQRRIALGAGEAERMRRLLEDMLLYTKPLSLDLQAVDVVSTLADFVAGYADGDPGRPLRLISTPTTAHILADEDRLRQILVNLTDNACQAAPEGTPVTWHVEEQTPEQRILLRVHNDGEPIPAHLLAHLTEPFFSTKTNGTGLGLAIVRRLVEQHGGEMRIASDPQTGTEVRLSFPALTPD